jgi:hypothetical protein
MTVDTLKYLDKLDTTYTTYNTNTLENLIQQTKSASFDGSYDGLVSPTTALLWLRAKYYGINSTETQKTIEWLLINMEVEDYREKILVLIALLELGVEHENLSTRLQKLLTAQLSNSHISEIDLLHDLKASLLLNDVDSIILCVEFLESKRNDDFLWIDVSISATIVNLLLEALDKLKAHALNTITLELTIETMVFNALIKIQQHMTNDELSSKIHYPWDNKANTTIKCICALLHFEKHIDLPISEITQTLKNEETSKQISAVDQSTVNVIELFKNENHNMKIIQQETNLKLSKIITDLQNSEVEKNELTKQNTELLERNNSNNQKLIEARGIIDQQNISTNFLIFTLSSWLAFIIIVLWTIVFLSSNNSILVSFKTFYKDLADMINASFLLVVALFTFLKFHYKSKGLNKIQ